MPILQPIIDLAELLVRRGITDVVVSPGSRSAPLTLAVARNPGLRVRVMADERAAGFVALGMAQLSRRPVALICTSGSAVYNLAPAVAEAYFQQVPLLLLTADRPHEWLYQQDGQTIDQAGIYGSHVKRSYDLPADYSQTDTRWAINRSVNEAITLSQLDPPGPVHLNVPVREPFYPTADDVFRPGPVRVIDTMQPPLNLSTHQWRQLLDDWEASERILILVGQQVYNPELNTLLQTISTELNIPVVGEITANLAQNGVFITYTDTVLAGLTAEQAASLRPDLLITLGNSLLTRNLKTFFRQYPADQHWHIQPNPDRISDSFQNLTRLIAMEPVAFLQQLFTDIDYQQFRQGDTDDTEQDIEFLTRWQTADRQAARRVTQVVNQPADPLTDWSAVQRVLEQLPPTTHLQLANSMPVRYANLCGLRADQQISVWANRGVSGIDGCLSTAVGAALQTDKLVTLLIGDVAFFYDRNALWSAPIPVNLRIVLLNNDSGHIFRIIDGPGNQPELEPYFETPHGYTARRTAEDAGLVYHTCTDLHALTTLLPDFFSPSAQAQLLEITTDKFANQEQFNRYRQQLTNS
ncbi:2-succinyl-5-enolpyruvyl-6-hydroxy-3-cyclohexene-1-carboxylic-acid synthase [Spirosoma rhododendri]|uniref:2-succinyl-5-enolpyruvyl-6-hydroxy-3-cyclohexene-1-carboxylate synthase n=1 Tax=Spirosoma rhododendri TaxID=2728024 RepID=A0A7L5DWV5_9BACT|nr:2-succinyl-5-enolpyruvyl-6-hydroxy-3-cyclohexene-1-carboxylic-acid synthase [Spirosoma rhododendri]QJD80030.1 2-succinyl-5-enolpyruvyl-6-hydroxy-3-cyclohexene-1-carboxylic-acid synthase [Spirosoma rhododendri]